jgi:hypothetical protein
MQDMFSCAGSTQQVVINDEDEEQLSLQSTSTSSSSTARSKTRNISSLTDDDDDDDDDIVVVQRDTIPHARQGIPGLCGASYTSHNVNDATYRIDYQPTTTGPAPPEQEQEQTYHYVIRLAPDKKRYIPHKRYTYRRPECSLRRTQSEGLSELPDMVSIVML